MKINNSILNILDRCTVEGNTVFLTCGQLDRNTYEAVNKCLENIGGKWNRKVRGHIFDSDPAELLDNLILTGETVDLKKQYQFFPTPRVIADQMCDLAEINGDCMVLEPSCGKGDLADAIWERQPDFLLGIELNGLMARNLDLKSYKCMYIDFLLYDSMVFNRIIMNPPFSKQQDIDHIMHAWDLLSPVGILVSVVSESPFFRENRKSVEFRQWLSENNAEVYENDIGAFKESGTMVKTRIIKVRKS